jgi:DNA-binding CsgD family transcriptional regulator
MMFIRVPVEKIIQTHEKNGDQFQLWSKELSKDADLVVQEALMKLTDGILIVTEEKKIIFANECACRILRQINQSQDNAESIPKEISYLCSSLTDIRRRFPGQHWLMTTKICISSSVTFNVHVRYMKLDALGKYCIVLMLKDQYQLIKTIAIEEASQYGLTDRETEIWLLQRANYTYKQIASELFIAPNTVKKHMQNIHLKQKGVSEDAIQQIPQWA